MSTPSTPSNHRAGVPSARSDKDEERRSVTSERTSATPSPSVPRLRHVAVPRASGVNLHHAHPLAVLERLLDDITKSTSRHHARYGHFVTSQGDDLVQLLQRCVRREVWDLVAKLHSQSRNTPTDPLDVDNLRSLGGDLSFYGRAIYLHILSFPHNTTRLYVGQAFNLTARIRNQHADWRYRRDHPSLHNYAMDRSTADSYVVLATVREACERSELVLNLLEMWMALWVGTLPDQVMEEWLGTAQEGGGGEEADRDREKLFGLNVGEPLDQGDKEAWKGAFAMLRESRHEMAREYFWDVRKRPRPVVAAIQDAAPASKWRLESPWIQYLPYVLGILAFGFVVGRWSVGVGCRR